MKRQHKIGDRVKIIVPLKYKTSEPDLYEYWNGCTVTITGAPKDFGIITEDIPTVYHVDKPSFFGGPATLGLSWLSPMCLYHQLMLFEL